MSGKPAAGRKVAAGRARSRPAGRSGYPAPVTEPGETPIRVAPSARTAKDWSLVLLAEGLPVRVAPADRGWGVWVPAAEAERAAALLELYLRENRPRPEVPAPAWPGSGPVHAALVLVAGLLLFFLVTGPAAAGSPWLERGASSARILAGEPWRAVTALTLHADTAHALSNAAAGMLFFSLAFRALGPGLGVALVLAAGALGNAVNAGLRAAPYLSVGASTSVFGAVGLLAGLAAARGGGGRRRPWVMAAAGLALLAMLGTGGLRTDVWAHFFGLVVGGVLGAGVGRWLERPPALAAQVGWGGVALALVAASWALARGEAG